MSPTNEEIKERFFELYSLPLDDLLYTLKKNNETTGILNNVKSSLYFDFSEFVLKNSDLSQTQLKK